MGLFVAGVDGPFGRPHIANFRILNAIEGQRQQAFEEYPACSDAPETPSSQAEVSHRTRNAIGIELLTHPNEPGATFLGKPGSKPLDDRMRNTDKCLLGYVDGKALTFSKGGEGLAAPRGEPAKKHDLPMTAIPEHQQAPLVPGT